MLGYIITFIIGIAVGTFGKFGADWLTDWRKNREQRRARGKAFADCETQMPEVFSVLRKALGESPLERTVTAAAFMDGKWSIWLGKFSMEESSRLRQQIQVLEGNGSGPSHLNPFRRNSNIMEAPVNLAR